MPIISRIGAPLQVRPVVRNTGWAPTDYVLSVGPSTIFPSTDAAGIVLSLPGPQIAQLPGLTPLPNPNPDNQLPGNGDFYKFADPRGVVDGETNEVNVWGGGYELWNGVGESDTLALFLPIGEPFESWEFTFDQANQVWIVCAGGPFQQGD
jgi:hypothetical protein